MLFVMFMDPNSKFLRRNLWQIKVEVCKYYICVQLQLSGNFALTAKYYSPRDTSSAGHFCDATMETLSSLESAQINVVGPLLLGKRSSKLL